MIRFISGLIKITVFLSVSLIVISRLFFSGIVESKFINPVRKVPVLGQVLGVSWDASGQIGPILTQKTVHLADTVEQRDLGIDEAIEKMGTDTDVSKSISEAIETQVQKQVSNLKDVPKETLKRVEQEIRSEMYKQICNGWKESSPTASKQ